MVGRKMEPKYVSVTSPDVTWLYVNLTGSQGIKFADGMKIANQIRRVFGHWYWGDRRWEGETREGRAECEGPVESVLKTIWSLSKDNTPAWLTAGLPVPLHIPGTQQMPMNLYYQRYHFGVQKKKKM